MKTLLRWTVVALTSALVVCLAGAPWGASRAADEKPRSADLQKLVGKPAPELDGDFNLNGPALKLSDFKGKIVLLEFWAPWSNPCVDTLSTLRDLEDSYKRDGLVVVGATRYYKNVSFDGTEGRIQVVSTAPGATGLSQEKERDLLKDFAQYHRLSFPLLLQTEKQWKQAQEDYHFTEVPTMVLIDRKGTVRMVRVGNSPRNFGALEASVKDLINGR